MLFLLGFVAISAFYLTRIRACLKDGNRTTLDKASSRLRDLA